MLPTLICRVFQATIKTEEERERKKNGNNRDYFL